MMRNENQLNYTSSPYLVFENIDGDKVVINNILLDKRQIIDIKLLEIYKYCRNARLKEDIYHLYGDEAFQICLNSRLILETQTMWSPLAFENVEIEINTVCNYKCEYCPVRYEPKQPQFMSIEDFSTIIEKITHYPTIKNVSLSSYNEPLIDPYFIERVNILAKHGLSLILHTNGSRLDKHMVDFLNGTGCINEVHVNFPCYDSEKYSVITGRNTFDQVCENIEYAIESGLNINFSIQKVDNAYKENLKVMNQLYSERLGKKITAWTTVDRAGILKNKYAQRIFISDTLAGCRNVLKWLTINVNGDCFICCNDYYNSYTYGNLLQNELSEIVASSSYTNIIQSIFGQNSSSEDFICRKCYEMKIMHTYKRMENHIRKQLNLL